MTNYSAFQVYIFYAAKQLSLCFFLLLLLPCMQPFWLLCGTIKTCLRILCLFCGQLLKKKKKLSRGQRKKCLGFWAKIKKCMCVLIFMCSAWTPLFDEHLTHRSAIVISHTLKMISRGIPFQIYFNGILLN